MLRTLARGARAGITATTVMTAVLAEAQRRGLLGEAPPRIITDEALDAVGAEEASETTRDVVTGLAHYGYGVAMGAIYAVASRPLRGRVPPVLAGAGFGLAVWAVSYMGWIPALGIMPPPSEDRPGRPGSMVAAHLVYGGVLGREVERLRREGGGRQG